MTPELPVPNVAEAQACYRDRLGFRIARTNAAGRIGAVSHGECAIFLRDTDGDIDPGRVRVFTNDVDAAHAARCPWFRDRRAGPRYRLGLRPFTVRDPCGTLFVFHHDL